jgi:transketolase
MLNEALKASELLKPQGFSLKVINMPWLNRVEADWLEKTVGDCPAIFVLDNHAPYGGLGDYLLNAIISSEKLRARRFRKFAVEGYPACGTPVEALKYHRLNGESLAERIISVAEKD